MACDVPAVSRSDDGRIDALEAEVKRLRDWRHEVATPRMVALEEQLKMTAAILKETADTVSAMRSEDEFARRLAAELHKRRWSALTAVEKIVLLLLAFVPLAGLILAVAGHVH